MKFGIYTVWLDPSFYIAAAVFAFSLFLLVFSIRKYLGIKNRSDYEEAGNEAVEVQGELPLAAAPAPAGHEAKEPDAPASAAGEAPSGAPSRAEEFVKGLYASLASLDGRVKNIEADLSRSRINRDFTVKFLEDIVSDFDALDKTKIRSRIEYLLSDLKKS
ncbi:MAG: hypothetical protein WCW52_04770 [Elusimicrobiales bacterium]|jgi:hypothetical protein